MIRSPKIQSSNLINILSEVHRRHFNGTVMIVILIAIVTTLLVSCDSASVTTCTNSYICGSGMCCMSSNGHVISDTEMGGFGGPFMPLGGTGQNGTCVTRKAQKGEICDSNCQCDHGLACYRPVSGVCCPPMTCYDEAYVQQQQAYWHKCMSDPNCPIPP